MNQWNKRRLRHFGGEDLVDPGSARARISMGMAGGSVEEACVFWVAGGPRFFSGEIAVCSGSFILHRAWAQHGKKKKHGAV